MSNAHFVDGIPNGAYCELNQTRNPLKEDIFNDPLTVSDPIMALSRRPDSVWS